MEKFYKPEKKSNLLGFVMLILAVTVAGCAVSALYLWINSILPLIYFCVAAAVLFGIGMGFLVGFIIDKFKITSKAIAVVGVVIGCLLFTYFKWGLYDAWDYEAYLYDWMKDYNAYEYYGFEDDFGELTNENITYAIEEMQSMSCYDYYGGDENYDLISEYFTADEIETLKSMTYYEFCGYDSLLGGTAEHAIRSLQRAKLMSLYEYDYEYLGDVKEGGLFQVLTNPKLLWEDIVLINEEGRWSITSNSSSSSSTEPATVNGVILMIVWIAELLIICIIPIAAANSKAGIPFIVKDNKWAKQLATTNVNFNDDIGPKRLREEITRDCDIIIRRAGSECTSAKAVRYYVSVFHSEDFEENYIDVSFSPKNNKNNSTNTVIKHLAVDKKYLFSLFKAYGEPFPFDTSEFGIDQPVIEENAEVML